MLGMPPPGYSPMPMSPGGQSTQLLGQQQNQNNPQMMQMLMQLAGKGGFGGHGMAGPTMGPVHEGPLGTPPPPMQGGMR